MIDLEALEALTEAATPATWGGEDDAFWERAGKYAAIYMTRAQNEFAVAAKAAMPELIAEIRQLRQQRDEVLAECAQVQAAETAAQLGAWQFARKVERVYASKEEEPMSTPEFVQVSKADYDAIAFASGGGFRSRDVSIPLDDEEEK